MNKPKRGATRRRSYGITLRPLSKRGQRMAHKICNMLQHARRADLHLRCHLHEHIKYITCRFLHPNTKIHQSSRWFILLSSQLPLLPPRHARHRPARPIRPSKRKSAACMDGRTDGCMDVWKYGRTDGCMDGCMNA